MAIEDLFKMPGAEAAGVSSIGSLFSSPEVPVFTPEETEVREEEFGVLREPEGVERLGVLGSSVKDLTGEKALQALSVIEDSPVSRGLGFAFGTLNAPFAALYGGVNAALQADATAVEENHPQNSAEAISRGLTTIFSAAGQSAKSSIKDKGEWGTLPSTVIESAIGMPLSEKFLILGDWAAPAVDLAVGLAFEGRMDLPAATKALKAVRSFDGGKTKDAARFQEAFKDVNAEQLQRAVITMREDPEFMGYLNDVVKYSDSEGAQNAVIDLGQKMVAQDAVDLDSLGDQLKYGILGRDGNPPAVAVAEPDVLSFTPSEFGRYNIQRVILDDYEKQLDPAVRKRVREGVRKEEFSIPAKAEAGVETLPETQAVRDTLDDFARNYNNTYAFNFNEKTDRAIVRDLATGEGFKFKEKRAQVTPTKGQQVRELFTGATPREEKVTYSFTRKGVTKEFDSLESAYKQLFATGIPTISDYRNATRIQRFATESVENSDSFIATVFRDPLDVTRADLAAADKKVKALLKGRNEENLTVSTRKALAKYGLRTDKALNTPLGKTYFQKVLRTRDAFEAQAGKDISDVTGVLRELSTEDVKSVQRLLDGTITATESPQVLEAYTKSRKVLDDLYRRGREAGIDIQYRENYFPHMILNHEILQGGSRGAQKKVNVMLEATVEEGLFPDVASAQKALRGYLNQMDNQNLSDYSYLDWMIQRGQAQDYVEAQQILRDMKYRKTEKFDPNVQASREKNLPWYDRNPATALSSYLYSANKLIENRKAFGKNLEEMDRYLARVKQEGGNTKVAELFSRQYFHPELVETNRLANFVMGWQVVTKLNPLTTCLNYTQNIVTAIRTNPALTMKAFWRTLRGKDQAYAERCGAILGQTIRESMQAQGIQGGIPAFYMKSIGFTTSERVLRSTAANAGRFYACDLFNMMRDGKHTKYARRRLEEMGVDVDSAVARGSLSDDDLLLVGKRVSDETQFRGDEFQVPVGWVGSPWARVITQFKTFAYNQAVFVKRQVLDEAKRGNMRPVIYMMSLYPPMSVGYSYLESVVLGKQQPETIPDWIFSSMASVGSLGLWQTAAEAAARGEVGMLELFTGPTISGVAEGATEAYKAMHGDLTGEIKRWGRKVPYVGRELYYWSLRDLE